MYRLLDISRPCADLGGWNAVVGDFTDVVGWTCFGDFFLRDLSDGQYATLIAMSPEVRALKYTDPESFESVFLKRDYIITRLLRPADVVGLEDRLGELGPEEVFIPAICPHVVSGNPDLSTYHKENVWAFAAHVAASHGIGKGDAVDSLPLHLRRGDDFELWRVALEHILRELPKTPGTLAQIGRCSHWLRPHQTRWTADSGFAWPTGYGSGTGGFSSNALPQFDWSVTLTWTGERWAPAKDKSAKLALRVTIPSRTGWHQQAAVHTVWMTGREKETRFYGFRYEDDVWRCTAESEWEEDRVARPRNK
jgi:hypothetical protein